MKIMCYPEGKGSGGVLVLLWWVEEPISYFKRHTTGAYGF